MATIKDSRTEAFLTRMGVDWKWTQAKVTDLVPNWQTNIARPCALRDDAIENYACLAENGSPPPGPILRRTERGCEVADGVQRITALIDYLKVNEFGAYEFETDSDTLATAIRLLANPSLQGHPEAMQWTKRQAVELLVIQKGMSLEEVSHMSGWKLADLKRLHTILSWGFVIRVSGGPTGGPREGLSDGVVMAIAAHAKLDDFKVAPKPIAEFCHDLKRGKFTNGDGLSSAVPHVETFFGGIDRKKGAKPRHKQFEQRLNRFRQDPDVVTRLGGRKSSPQSPEMKLRQTMRSTLTVSTSLLNARAEVRYMEEFFQLWNQVEHNLKTLAKVKAKPSVGRKQILLTL